MDSQLAERGEFEPPIPFQVRLAFEASAFNRLCHLSVFGDHNMRKQP